MSTTALYVSETWLKTNTAISANMDIKMIYPFVTIAQDLFIQNILGSKLHETLKSRIANANANSDETILLDLCTPAVAWRAVSCALPFHWMQIRNRGLNTNNAENSQPAGRADMLLLKSESDNMAEFYERQVQKYLVLNATKFPDYVVPDIFGIVPTSEPAFELDLYLGPIQEQFAGADFSNADLLFYRKYIQS